METKLKRCLSLFDLVMIGIGNMIGAGIFVITGNVMKNVAGPGVIISFAFAGLASFLSALCYAEFGARVPKAGSAYTYTYVTIGELTAFIVGWNVLLESLIGASSVAKAWSGSLDVLANGSISNFTLAHIGSLDVPLISHYLDFVAFACLLFWVIFVAAGVKCSSGLISFFTFINIAVLMLIIFLGFYFADFSYWTKDFLPYGFSGSVAGSASCFYAYAGFEAIAVAGEETKNPSKNIPLALGISVLVVTILYLLSSAALTVMVPYKEVDIVAPFPAAIRAHKANWATNIIAIGSLIGLSACLIGSLFGMPRAVYSMASDGLVFGCLGYVHPKTQTPLFAIIFCSLISSLMALLIDLEFLVELLSIGTLLCFIIVSASVVILRYQPVASCQFELKVRRNNVIGEIRNSIEQDLESIGRIKRKYRHFHFLDSIPIGYSGPMGITLVLGFASAVWSVILYGNDLLLMKLWWAILLLIVFCLGFILSCLFLYLHEENRSFTTFQVNI